MAIVAVVDYGMGNLYSVRRACETVCLAATITGDPDAIRRADGVILPGVGAMPDAVDALEQSGLGDALREAVAEGKPLFGICLGMQLLISHGAEFRPHDGLGLVAGEVLEIQGVSDSGRPLRVPHIGWNSLELVDRARDPNGMLGGVGAEDFMYFVHSFVVVPEHASQVVATTRYGSVEFCSVLTSESIFACQFHPEKSGPAGLRIYDNFAKWLHA